jgi:hypothetical protein
LALFLKASSLIIWDESASTNKFNIESVNILMQDLMGNKLLFGGEVVVFGGDFRQTLPVVEQGSRADIISVCISSSFIWPLLIKKQLITNQRLAQAPESQRETAREYDDWLLRIGNGTHTPCQPDGDPELTELLPHLLLTSAAQADAQPFLQPGEFLQPDVTKMILSTSSMVILLSRCLSVRNALPTWPAAVS